MHATSTVEELLDVLEDGRIGFSHGADRLDRDGYASLAAMFRDLSDERAVFADELRGADFGDAELGGRGGVASVAHRGWRMLRDAIAGDDPVSVLAVAEQSEDRTRSVYEHVLSEVDLPAPTREILRRHHAAVKAAHDRVRVARGARLT